MLANPEGWLRVQLKLCREDPDRMVRPTCAAIAGDVYGDANRAEEVVPVLQAYLDQEALY